MTKAQLALGRRLAIARHDAGAADTGDIWRIRTRPPGMRAEQS